MHAAQRAAERAAAPEAKPKAVSGRLLDAGIIASKADAESKDVAARPTLNARVHHHNPDGAAATQRVVVVARAVAGGPES